MKNGKSINRQSSAGNSRIKLQLANRKRRESPKEFLAKQASASKSAIVQTIREMKDSAIKAVDIPSWARERPWLVVGSAIAVGAVAGAVITRALDNARENKRIVLATRRAPLPVEYGAPRERRRLASLAGFLAGTLGNVVRTLVQSSISAATAAVVAKEHVEEATDDLQEASEDLKEASE